MNTILWLGSVNSRSGNISVAGVIIRCITSAILLSGTTDHKLHTPSIALDQFSLLINAAFVSMKFSRISKVSSVNAFDPF